MSILFTPIDLVATPENQSASGEHKHRPTASEGTDLLNSRRIENGGGKG